MSIAGIPPMNQFLRMAVVAGIERAVQIHIDRGDDLNARDANGMTPLMLSAARNKPAICRLLLIAGADRGLLDPSGKTAHEIAVTTGASEAAAILSAIQVATHTPPNLELPSQVPSTGDTPVAEAKRQASIALAVQADAVACKATVSEPPSTASALLVVEIDDPIEFDLSGWKAEVETVPPEVDLSVVDSARTTQRVITSYESIDSSAEWDDIEAWLPKHASPLVRVHDTEARVQLRRFLLRAIREKSVPKLDVQKLSINADGSANPEAEAFLSMVINDLGAEVDEHFEYSDAFGSLEAFIDPKETPDEEAVLDETLAAIDNAASPYSEPLRLYLRELQKFQLLSAKKEVELAQTMETSLEAALDALVAWPQGLAQTLAIGHEVKSGKRPLSSMSRGNAEPDIGLPAADDQNAKISVIKADKDKETLDEGEGELSVELIDQSGGASFIEALVRLEYLVIDSAPPPHTVRNVLNALQLSRPFLLELCDISDPSDACARYKKSMATYRDARDHMTTANLKLAFSLAKKFLYSGEPLGDLAQEANIGLLKAVDRYDWRRGFRFSTYATWWIRQQIGRHVANNCRTIRVPVHVHEKIQRLQQETRTLEFSLRRTPTIDELATRMGMPPSKVISLLCIGPPPLPIDELPLDEMIAIDVRDAFVEPDPADVIDAAKLWAAVNGLLSSLPHKDEKILRLRFGIDIVNAMTLEEIGQLHGITRERVRQIEAKAIRRLKHPKLGARKLLEFDFEFWSRRGY